MPGKVSLPSTASVVGGLIRQQRVGMRMTVAELAQRIGVSRNTITNYEMGKTDPNAGDLVRLSGALGCTVGELVQAVAPPPPVRFAFRFHAGLWKEQSVLVSARKFLRAYKEIEEITETRLCNRLELLRRGKEGPLKDREIEGLADNLRQQGGLYDSGPENIAGILESLGVRCLFFDFDNPDLDAVSAIQGDTPLIMLANRHKSIERIIFAGARELGHLVMHRQWFTPDRDANNDGRTFAWEAEKFAGYFLVPSDDLSRIWREDRLQQLELFHALLLLKRAFPVSYWRLFGRVKELGLSKMDFPAFAKMTKAHLGLGGKARVEASEPEPLDDERLRRTTRFELLIRSAFVQELVGTSKVAELLQICVEDAQELTARWLKPETFESKRSSHELVENKLV